MPLENNAYEVGLERLVDDGKPADYIGKAALARIKREGVTRKSVGVEIAGDPIPFNSAKWPVTANGKAVGVHHVSGVVATAQEEHRLCHAADSAHGNRHEAERRVARDRRARAKVVVKPFVDPEKAIPKN